MKILTVFFIIIVLAWFAYQTKTKDYSLQGFFEYLKDKYWTKH